MGLSPSGDIFCHRTDKAVQGLEGVLKQVDDCLAMGKSVEELEERLVGLLERCRTHNIIFLKQKFKVGKSLGLGGYIIDSISGELQIGPDPSRIEAIKSMTVPESKKQVHEFLGVVRTLESWTPHISASSKQKRYQIILVRGVRTGIPGAPADCE